MKTLLPTTLALALLATTSAYAAPVADGQFQIAQADRGDRGDRGGRGQRFGGDAARPQPSQERQVQRQERQTQRFEQRPQGEARPPRADGGPPRQSFEQRQERQAERQQRSEQAPQARQDYLERRRAESAQQVEQPRRQSAQGRGQGSDARGPEFNRERRPDGPPAVAQQRQFQREQSGVGDRRFDSDRRDGQNRWNDNRFDGRYDQRWHDQRRVRDRDRPRFDPRRWQQRNWRAPRQYQWVGVAWRPPSGYYYRTWSFGQTLPWGWYSSNYYIDNWWAYGLPMPPAGFEWIRNGRDAILVDVFTGRIYEVAYGLFW